MNTIITCTVSSSAPKRMPYSVFILGLDQLYLMPLIDGEDIHDRCLAIDRYIDSNGWSWDAIIEEMAKPEVDINRN